MAKTLQNNIKDLKISKPSALGLMSSNLKSNVILVAKFDFQAETKEELSVSRGDVLKLLDRFSNGWVLVKFIDKVQPPGLVPCLYVDIAINDPLNPITLEWLHQGSQGSKAKSKSFVDAQVEFSLADNAPLTINNMPYPLTVVVSHYLTYEDRFWYRVDVTYSTGEQGYLCRYYQDFYDLHAALLEMYNSLDSKNGDELGKLPKLPEPVPSNKRNSTEQRDLFSHRCRELSTYTSELIRNKSYQVSPALVNWLDRDYRKRPGFVVDCAINDTNEVISHRILPNSVILASESKFQRIVSPDVKKFDGSPSKFAIPPGSESQHPKSKNTYNHYHQAALPSVGRSASTREPLRSTSQKWKLPNTDVGRSKTITSVTAGQSMEVKSQPPRNFKSDKVVNTTFPSAQTPPSTVPQIKCKIKTQSSDILIVKLNKLQITSIDVFKGLIYKRIAFNNLFIKFPQSDSFQEIESLEIDSLLFLRKSDRVLLLVT